MRRAILFCEHAAQRPASCASQCCCTLLAFASFRPQVKLVPADKAPKRGKGGSLASRQAMLHALVHIENAAIDLAWWVGRVAVGLILQPWQHVNRACAYWSAPVSPLGAALVGASHAAGAIHISLLM